MECYDDDDDDDTPQRGTESELFIPRMSCVPALVSAAAEHPEIAGIVRRGLKQLLLDVKNRRDTTVGGKMSLPRTETNNEAHRLSPPGMKQRER